MSWEDVFGSGVQSKAPKSSPPPSPPQPSGQPQKRTGILANAAAGANETIDQVLGLPSDAVAAIGNLGIRGLNAVAGTKIPQITNPQDGTAWQESIDGLIGADPRNVVPANGLEQAVRATTAAATSALVPFGAARAFPALTGLAGVVQDALGAGGVAGVAAAGGAGGLTGQIASNLAPDQWKSVADAGGNILGGGLAAGTVAAGRALIDNLAGISGRFFAPMVGRARPITDESGAPIIVLDGQGVTVPVMAKPGQAKLAGQKIAQSATNLPQVRETLAESAPALVRGSAPTTFQATGDSGLGQLERAAYTRSPQMFLDRVADQNAARVAAVGRLAPEDADPSAVGDLFRRQIAAMDADAQAAYERQMADAQQATANLGNAPPAGEDQQASMLQRFGRTIRAAPAAGDAAAEKRTSAIFDAIDPDGKLMVPMTAIRQSATEILKERPWTAGPLDPKTQAIFGTAQMSPAQTSFKALSKLRSRVTNQLMVARVTPEMAEDRYPLTQLLGSIDATLSGAVEETAAQEAEAVRSGQMDPLDTIAAKLSADSQSWLERRRATGPGSQGQGSSSADLGARHPSRGLAGLPGVGGRPSAGTRGPGNAGSNPGVAAGSADVAEASGRLWDQAAAAEYARGRASHAERMAIFHDAPGVGEILKPGKLHGTFETSDSSVPSIIAGPGKEAAERIQAYQKAGGDMGTVADYLAFDLRRAAEDADGTIDPKKYGRWMNGHQETMTAFPELRQKFATAAKARETLDADAAERAADIKRFQTVAVQKFLGEHDPVDEVASILRSNKAIPMMADLAKKTANDPAARQGLQRAVVDFILRDLRSNRAAGQTDTDFLKGDALQTFTKKETKALSYIFPSEQMKEIRSIAADIRRSETSWSGTKLPGQSNTAQDFAGRQKHSMLTYIAEQIAEPGMAGILGGEATGSWHGVAAGVMVGAAKKMVTAMRAAGLRRVDDLVTLAMLHPDLAKALLRNVSSEPNIRMIIPAVVHQLMRAAAAEAVRPVSAPVASDREPPSIFPGWNAPQVSQFSLPAVARQ